MQVPQEWVPICRLGSNLQIETVQSADWILTLQMGFGDGTNLVSTIWVPDGDHRPTYYVVYTYVVSLYVQLYAWMDGVCRTNRPEVSSINLLRSM